MISLQEGNVQYVTGAGAMGQYRGEREHHDAFVNGEVYKAFSATLPSSKAGASHRQLPVLARNRYLEYEGGAS